MADTPIRIKIPDLHGQTITGLAVLVTAPNAGAIINGGGDLLVQSVPGGMMCEAVISEALVGKFDYLVTRNGNPAYYGTIDLVDTTDVQFADAESGAGDNQVILTLVDDASDQAIRNAKVTIQTSDGVAISGAVDFSDPDGQVEFNLTDGDYHALITTNGFESSIQAFTVDGNTETELRLIPEPVAADPGIAGICRVHCWVKLNDTAIEGATVKARLLSPNSAVEDVVLSNAIADVRTDVDGYAELRLVRQVSFTDGNGIYRIEVCHLGKVVATIDTAIPDQNDVTLEDLIGGS